MRYLSFFLLLTTCFACQSETDTTTKTATSLQRKDLIGTWEQTTLLITYNSNSGIEDSITVFEVKEENWVQTLSIQPVRSIFMPDSTFRQEFRTPSDSLYSRQRGLWNLIDDTLIMITPEATYTYQIELSGSGLSHYRSVLDWDGDGVEDDAYEATHRLVSRKVE